MAKVDDTLPLKRTYVQEQLGQLVGIFEIDRKRLGNAVEARALPSSDGEVGLVAVANLDCRSGNPVEFYRAGNV